MVTWCKNHATQGLSINFGDDQIAAATSFRLNTNSRFFGKKKGSKLAKSEESKIEIFWNLLNAEYNITGPEPIDGFDILIIVDSEIGLVLGDMVEETVTKKFKNCRNLAKSSLISWKKNCSENALYSTKAQFCETGNWHDIMIRCSEENEGFKSPALSVCIDQKTAICVKRLRWNFRGNQTIFVDGLLVDLFWDVHDWVFNPASGYAISCPEQGVD